MTLADALAVPTIETQPVHFAVLDGDGRLLFVNNAWREFGQHIRSVIRPTQQGCNYLDGVQQTDCVAGLAIAQALEQVLLDGEESAQATYSSQTAGGERRFRMQLQEFTLETERYVAVTHVDVTAQERNVHDIAGFRQAIEAAGHAIFVTNADGRITYANPAFERITGYETTEALGQTPRILKSSEMSGEYYDRLWESILAGEVWDEPILNRRKSGELYYAHQTIAPVLDDDGNPVEFVSIQTDVTELQVTRAGTEKLGTLLRHDLRNELNVVQSYAELIAQRDGEVAEYAARIVETVSELLETTEKGIRLQNFLSKTHQPVLTDISDVIESAVSRARLTHPTAEISVDTTDDIVGRCLLEIEVAFLEFIENSVVHNDSESPQVDVSVEETDEWVEIRIADNGPGTPAMEYESLDSPSTDLYHDTGFGLNLAYWIVRHSGGNISFEQNEPRGTIVTVRLPVPSQ